MLARNKTTYFYTTYSKTKRNKKFVLKMHQLCKILFQLYKNDFGQI